MDNPLKEHIATLIEREGALPFDRFMEEALYHHEWGFYSSGRVRIGTDEGAFTTSPHISSLFAECIAGMISRGDQLLGNPVPFTFVEGGCGEGLLARQILDSLEANEPGLYSRFRYRLDERSPALVKRQRETLSGHTDKVDWKTGRGNEGIYFSNELIDAFPVRIFEKKAGELFERLIMVSDDRFGWTLAKVGDDEPDGYPGFVLPKVADDFVYEFRPGLDGWVEKVNGIIKRGWVVTVDYGDLSNKLYGPNRPQGTVTGYDSHRQVVDVLEAVGERDITAHVDFSALIIAAEKRGLAASTFLNQREFLFALDIDGALRRVETRTTDQAEIMEARNRVGALLMEAMGSGFKVLVQSKNMTAPLVEARS